MPLIEISFTGKDIAEINGSIIAYAAALGAVPSTPLAPAAPAAQPSASPVPPEPSGSTELPASGNLSDVELDAAGVAWDAAKHAGTKAKVASGLWRMKVGVKRAPGEGEEAIPKDGGSPTVPSVGAAPAATPIPPVSVTPPAPPAPPIDPNRPTDPNFCHDNGNGTEQWFVNGAWDAGQHPIPVTMDAPFIVEDEFAAFASAAGSVSTERTWTDADLAMLGNQAAQKVGAPEPIKAVIAKYATPGGIGHSREIPVESREAYARELEATFGFQYAAA